MEPDAKMATDLDGPPLPPPSPPPSPLAAMAERARDPEAGKGIALLWLPTPAADPSARVEW